MNFSNPFSIKFFIVNSPNIEWSWVSTMRKLKMNKKLLMARRCGWNIFYKLTHETWFFFSSSLHYDFFSISLIKKCHKNHCRSRRRNWTIFNGIVSNSESLQWRVLNKARVFNGWCLEDSTWKKVNTGETFPFYSIKCSLLIFPLAIVLRLSLNSIAFSNDSNETRTFYAQRGSGEEEKFLFYN